MMTCGPEVFYAGGQEIREREVFFTGLPDRIGSSAIETVIIEIGELAATNAKLKSTFNAELKKTYIALLALADMMPEAVERGG